MSSKHSRYSGREVAGGRGVGQGAQSQQTPVVSRKGFASEEDPRERYPMNVHEELSRLKRALHGDNVQDERSIRSITKPPLEELAAAMSEPEDATNMHNPSHPRGTLSSQALPLPREQPREADHQHDRQDLLIEIELKRLELEQQRLNQEARLAEAKLAADTRRDEERRRERDLDRRLREIAQLPYMKEDEDIELYLESFERRQRSPRRGGLKASGG